MRGFAVISAATAMLAACSPAPEAQGDAPVFDGPGPQAVDLYEGQLVALNGEGLAAPSKLEIRLYTFEGMGETPTRYFISSDCKDAGYFDTDHQLFLSGHSPIGTGAEDADRALLAEMADPERRCPSADPARYAQLMELMQEGAALEIDGNEAIFTGRAGKSARFRTLITD